MDPVVCEERHKNLSENMGRQERRINTISERVDKVEQFQSRSDVKIENLCDQIANLVATIKWGGGICITALVGFFIWYIQSL